MSGEQLARAYHDYIDGRTTFARYRRIIADDAQTCNEPKARFPMQDGGVVGEARQALQDILLGDPIVATMPGGVDVVALDRYSELRHKAKAFLSALDWSSDLDGGGERDGGPRRVAHRHDPEHPGRDGE
jgi:hypothetical protein